MLLSWVVESRHPHNHRNRDFGRLKREWVGEELRLGMVVRVYWDVNVTWILKSIYGAAVKKTARGAFCVHRWMTLQELDFADCLLLNWNY